MPKTTGSCPPASGDRRFLPDNRHHINVLPRHINRRFVRYYFPSIQTYPALLASLLPLSEHSSQAPRRVCWACQKKTRHTLQNREGNRRRIVHHGRAGPGRANQGRRPPLNGLVSACQATDGRGRRTGGQLDRSGYMASAYKKRGADRRRAIASPRI